MAIFRRFGWARDLIAGFGKANAGNVAMIFAIAAVPIVGSIGTAVDYAQASDIKSRLQAALDAALLAGTTQPSAQQVSTASAVFSGNYSGKYGTTATAAFTQNANGSLSGTANSSVKTSFLGVFGIPSIAVSATGTATTATSGTQTKSNVCILLVNPLKSQALLVNSGAKITAPNCEIDVLSTQNPAAMFNDTLSVNNICIKGSTIVKNGGATPPATTSCAAISDPFANKLPTVTVGSTCDFTNQTYPLNNGPTSVTLNPGTYCGSTNFNGSGTLTLNPGLYIIKSGAMTFNSGWTITGTGVTFYLVDQNATITFNGGVNATLSAPTTGTYANILMFEPPGLSNTNLPINGSSGDSFTGLFYLPSRDVTINSVSNVTGNNVTMVFSTLILDKTNWSISPGALGMSRATGTGTSTGVAHLSN
jgi:Flp pilus assembly protein TadG